MFGAMTNGGIIIGAGSFGSHSSNPKIAKASPGLQPISRIVSAILVRLIGLKMPNTTLRRTAITWGAERFQIFEINLLTSLELRDSIS